METRTDDRPSQGRGPSMLKQLSEIMRGSGFGRRQHCRGQTVRLPQYSQVVIRGNGSLPLIGRHDPAVLKPIPGSARIRSPA